jgi:hypothetical protein
MARRIGPARALCDASTGGWIGWATPDQVDASDAIAGDRQHPILVDKDGVVIEPGEYSRSRRRVYVATAEDTFRRFLDPAQRIDLVGPAD